MTNETQAAPTEQHARFAPSAASRWLHCAGSINACADMPDTDSEFADEGTAAHQLASWALDEQHDAADYLGQVIEVKNSDGTVRRSFTVDEDMAGYVQVYIDSIRDAADGGHLLVEQRVEFSAALGIENQFGTVDAGIIKGTTLEVHDLKYGRGVQVDARDNPQLMLYALGALHEFGPLMHTVKQIRLCIHQPRLDHFSEHWLHPDELLAFGQTAAAAAQLALQPDAPRTPGEAQCRFCPFKPLCPEAAAVAHNAVFSSFNDLGDTASADAEQLAHSMSLVAQVRDWCKAIEDAVKDRLHAGEDVPGFKLVQGRAGNRQWVDEKQVDVLLKSQRVKKDDRYVSKLISPAQAEKAFRKQRAALWEKLDELVTRGKPSVAVAPVDDPRPPIMTSNDFSDLTQGE